MINVDTVTKQRAEMIAAHGEAVAELERMNAQAVELQQLLLRLAGGIDTLNDVLRSSEEEETENLWSSTKK